MKFCCGAIASALTLVSLLVLSTPCHAEVQFPVSLTRENLELHFEVDSTWHLIKGVAEKVRGTVTLIDEKDPTTLQITASFPVRSLNTDHESRDERLREVMHEALHPEVMLHLKNSAKECNVQLLSLGTSCTLLLSGELEISGTKKEISLPATVIRESSDEIKIAGTFELDWPDYGVDDPSILVATLDPHVVITFASKVPYGKHS